MLNYSNLVLENLAVHRVANKHRAERNFISDNLLQIDEALREALNHYFIKPLKRTSDLYRFVHTSDVALNEVYSYAKSIFENPDSLLEESVNILHHLYAQSNHYHQILF